jgi:hypothetical protein
MKGSSQHWTPPEDGLLLGRNALRKENKIVHVSWETLYCLHAISKDGAHDIKKDRICLVILSINWHTWW